MTDLPDKELTDEVMAAFEKFEKATGKSVEGFTWEYTKKGEPYRPRRIVFSFKELTWPFNTNAKPPDKIPNYGGIFV